MVSHEGWRSIIRDACDLRELLSHGDVVKGMKFPILDSLTPQRHEKQESRQSSERRDVPQA